jgi:hypothetical protein
MMMVMLAASNFLMLHKIYIFHFFHFLIDAIARLGTEPPFGLRTKDCANQAMEKEVEK